jgi:histone deacetylase 1/2
VGNGATLPVVGTGYSTIPGPFHINDVLVVPHIIKNRVSVEFDPLGISVKDLRTKDTLLRCDSTGPIYTLQLPSTPSSPCVLVATPSPTTWHRRLGHLGAATLHHLAQDSSIICNSKPDNVPLCHACQLGRHVRLPFTSSTSRASQNFDLIHCDLWTSPIVSVSGFKYYLIIVMIARILFGLFPSV